MFYPGRTIDAVARAPLWKSGLDYPHGTGHGIGYFLSVHEDPPYGNKAYDEPYAAGMFQSDEPGTLAVYYDILKVHSIANTRFPGYYEDNKFGIRLETDLEVVDANTTVSHGYSFSVEYFRQ